MSINPKQLILFKFILIVLVTKFMLIYCLNDEDNQLVAFAEDDENNDLNNLNQGNLSFFLLYKLLF